MYSKFLLPLIVIFQIAPATVFRSEYADITDNLIIPPASASMAGSDLSNGNGVSVESTPANLAFDSLNRLSLSYAGFYNNSFSTSIVTYNGKPQKNIGIGLLVGYIYIPDIMDNTASEATEDNEIRELKYTYFSASKIIVRVGAGQLYTLSPTVDASFGVALNAKRIRIIENGYGLGLDAGAKIVFKSVGVSCALQLENVTSSYTYWNKHFQERAFHHLRAGVGFNRYFPSLFGALQLQYATPDLFANEGINSIDRKKNPANNWVETITKSELYEEPLLLIREGKFGIEYSILNTVSFRGGIAGNRFTFGAGLHFFRNKAGIDLAYISHILAGTYQLSLNYQW